MLVRGISLTNFRNIEKEEVSFCEGVNVLFGDNAEGKTNLLEAIYLMSIGKSFRGQHAQELVRFGEREATISLTYHGMGREQSLSLKIANSRFQSVEKNRLRLRKMSEMVGSLRAVLFSPEHLSLVKDGPAERRSFLDIAISAQEPLYLAALQRYGRVLKQRNALIRAAEQDKHLFESTVDIWSSQLASEAAYIAKCRSRYIKRAEAHVKRCFLDMTGERETPTLQYLGIGGKELADYEDEAAVRAHLYRRLCENHERELGAGATLYGIHKDDMEVTLNGRSARSFCSQGQQRSLALALKIAEGEICLEECGEYPVLLLDDVLSELDRGRREYLLQHIKGKQVIITTCEKEGMLAENRILVKNGTYRQE